MKSNFIKFVGAGVIALSASMLPLTLPAQAQVNQPGTQTTPAPGTTGTTVVQEDDGFDWGWLGLIGLLGLAGLAGRNRSDNEPTRYRDPNAVGSTTYRE